MIDISLNGARAAVVATTLQALLLARGYKLESAFACAINNTFVPRQQWVERMLQNDDRVDIVTPITGG
ncbi:MAG: sulfur carrier protein ThiS [Vitreoscilla sp.]|nr:sulfur carrier protein ThiS [Polaromonas sp.]